MSFTIRNKTGLAIEFKDLGITIDASADLNLRGERSQDIQESTDLVASIIATDIVVIDPKDGVTELSAVDSQTVVEVHNDPHWPITSRWKNIWASGTYEQDDMVRDGNWTMIANTQTTDRAAPQTTGDPEWEFSDTPAWSTTNLSGLRITGFRATVAELVIIDGIRVWVESIDPGTEYFFQLVDVTDSANERLLDSGAVDNSNAGWVEVGQPNLILSAGQVIEGRLYQVRETVGTSFAREWDSLDYAEAADPGVGNWARNVTHDTISISETDANAGNAAVDLATLVAGDSLDFQESGSSNRIEHYTVDGAGTDNGGWWTFSVTLDYIDREIRVNRTTDVDGVHVGGNTALDVVSITNYWVDDPNIDGFIVTDPADIAANLNDNGYGFDLRHTDFIPSPDWDLVAFTGEFDIGGGATNSRSVEDSGVEILSDFNTLNFTDNLTVVDNGGGEAGISLSDNPIVGGTGSVTVPDGTTGERPGSPVNGMMRYNTTEAYFEFYQDGEWRTFSAAGTGPGTITGTIIGYHFLLDANKDGLWDLWMGTTTRHIASNEVPYVMPYDTSLIGLTFTNDVTNTDVDIEVHRSVDGAGTTTDIPFIWYIRGGRVGRRTDMAIPFSVGDKVAVFARTPSDFGFHIVNVGGVRVGGDATGLANDATVYTASVSVDGGGAQPIAVTGSTAQTYTTLITELDTDTAGAAWSIVNGNLVCTSTSTGTGSTVVITDTDLFSSLTDFIALGDDVRGADLADIPPGDTVVSVLMQMASEIFVEVLENYVGDFVE